jgi:hypothetical protein
MKANSKSIAGQERAAQSAARSVVCQVADKNPELFADKLVANPELAVGLKDLPHILDCLIKGGQRQKLHLVLDSRSLPNACHARRVITEKLLTS